MWRCLHARKELLDRIGATLKVSSPGDWQGVTGNDIRKSGGASLLQAYDGSVYRLLQHTYPELDLQVHEVRRRVPHRYWDSPETCRRLLDAIAKRHGIVEQADWKRVSVADVKAAGGQSMVRRHGSLRAALAVAYPDQHLPPAVAKRWTREDCRTFLDSLAEQKGFDPLKAEQWQQVRNGDVLAAEGGPLLRLYGHSLTAALRDCYPELAGQQAQLRGSRQPRGFWRKEANQREFLAAYAASHGIRDMSGWSDVTAADIIRAGGRGLLAQHSNSLPAALDAILGHSVGSQAKLQRATSPSASTTETSTKHMRYPAAHWQDLDACRRFLTEAAGHLGVATPADWSNVTAQDLAQLGGSGLVREYGGDMRAMLQAAFPDEDWEGAGVAAAVRRRRKGFWHKWENRKQFMEEVAASLGIKELSQWRSVKASDVVARGGKGFLEYYPSLMHGVQDVYPETADVPLATYAGKIPGSHWQDAGNVRRYIREAEGLLQIRQPEEWERISQEQVRQIGGSSLLRHVGLAGALQLAYPGRDWSSVTRGAGKATQRLVLLALRDMFPGEKVDEEYAHPGMQSYGRLGQLELDVYVHGRQLAVEYNGEHHYHQLPFFGSLQEQEARDKAKQEACAALGIRLLVVPYWWDRKAGSLARTLHDAYPSLLSEDVLIKLDVEGHQPIGKQEVVAKHAESEMEEALALMLEKGESPRQLVVQLQSGRRQVVRCSARQWDSLPPPGAVVSVSHFGRYGKQQAALRAPFLKAQLPGVKWKQLSGI